MEDRTKEPQDPKAKTEYEPSTREEKNWSKIEKKIIQIQTVGTLQD